jgi:flagellar motor switch protein FliM
MDSTDSQSPPAQAISQSEVDHLLAQVGGAESSAAGSDLSGQNRQPGPHTVRYDFRQPSFLSASELRKLKVRQEEFIRSLAARLSIYLRLEFGLQMSKLETLSFQKFIEGLSNPTHLTLFKLEPLRGVCLLEIPPRLGLSIVDRQLGGPAHCADASRDLSEIEVGLLDQSIEIILSEWCGVWSGMLDLRPTLLGHENSGRFLQTSPHDTLMLIVTMEARIGETVEQMQIGLPYYTLAPLIAKLDATLETSEKATVAVPAVPLKWNAVLQDIKIPVSAGWSDLEIPARQLAMLKPGDVFPLSPEMAGQVQVRLAKVPKFIGNLGTLSQRWAVKITQVLKT